MHRDQSKYKPPSVVLPVTILVSGFAILLAATIVPVLRRPKPRPVVEVKPEPKKKRPRAARVKPREFNSDGLLDKKFEAAYVRY